MGGFGTWDVISRWPYRFAGAIAICGGADHELLIAQAAQYQLPPVWAFHGDLDVQVMPARSSKAIESLHEAGVPPEKAKLTIYPGVGHDAWTPTFGNPAAAAWLFSCQ